jgi:predicted DsbA family dithiol-disulfide isomerase
MLIEIFADLICPWCFIGWRRLRRAVAERPALSTQIRWRPFQLNPDMPPGGMDRQLYLHAKFGSRERARQIYGVVEETARRDGLALDLSRIRRTPNTFDAHRLIRWAEQSGEALTLVEGLFSAYFMEGADISDHETLVAVAAAAGYAPDAAKFLLSGAGEATEVRAADAQARQMGLHAVPCFVFDRRYALSGAQEASSLLPLLDLGVCGEPRPEACSGVTQSALSASGP